MDKKNKKNPYSMFSKELQASLTRGMIVVAEKKLKEAIRLLRLAYKEIK